MTVLRRAWTRFVHRWLYTEWQQVGDTSAVQQALIAHACDVCPSRKVAGA